MATLKVYPCIAHVTSPLAQRYSLKRMSSSLMRDESDVSGRAITDGSAGPMPVLPLAALGVALLNTLRRVTNSPYSFIVLLHRIYYCIFICAVTPESMFFSKSTLKFLGNTCGSEANAAPELNTVGHQRGITNLGNHNESILSEPTRQSSCFKQQSTVRLPVFSPLVQVLAASMGFSAHRKTSASLPSTRV